MPSSRKRKKQSAPKAGPHATRGGMWPFVMMLAFAAILGGGVWLLMGGGWKDDSAGATTVIVPTLDATAAKGRAAFDRVCASCHGKDGGGGDGGPPLINRIYHPGHHGDQSIRLAIIQGARQHHWKFGNMPPQPDIAAAEIDAIIAFLRATQKANGIF